MITPQPSSSYQTRSASNRRRILFSAAILIAGTVALLASAAAAQLGAAFDTMLDTSGVGWPGLTNQASGNFGKALAVGDFNGNGIGDLVIGFPGQPIAGHQGAGGVVVMADYQGEAWIVNRFYNQGVSSFEANAEAGDNFGASFAIGDFNWDGYDDLAIGVPGEDIAAEVDAGTVHVVYGAAGGLNTGSQVTLIREVAPGSSEEGAKFGYAMAAGDFNGDGYDDLAISAPLETVQGAARAGVVVTIHGGGAGLDGSGQWWSQWQLGASNGLDTAETNDAFGTALAAGDFNHDGFDDLAVGVPRESAAENFTGAINVIYGNFSGLVSAGNLFTAQHVSRQQTSQRFGSSLAAADFNGDGIDDLAVGVPYADVTLGTTTAIDAGRVAVFHGRQDQPFDADDPSQPYLHELLAQVASREYFGSQVVAGDFDNDGIDDFAIAAPGETVGGQVAAGRVEVRRGDANGNYTSGQAIYNQAAYGIFGEPETDDGFGTALAVGIFTGDDADLVVGTPFEDFSGVDDTGMVHVIFSSPNQLFMDGFESGDTGNWSSGS